MAKYFYDCEFVDTGFTIDLISIGIVSEDGREFYAQSCEFDSSKASGWVQDNVYPHLTMCQQSASKHIGHTSADGGMDRELLVHRRGGEYRWGQCRTPENVHVFTEQCPWRTRKQIAEGILRFMDPRYDMNTKGYPELWGYYSAYDHVAFCQLFGTMMDLPPGFPMYTRDLKQLADSLGNPELPKEGKGEHSALLDARWNRTVYQFLSAIPAPVVPPANWPVNRF